MNEKFDISVIVLSYNPNFRKIMQTIESIVNQKDINLELIIADDGSEKNYFKQIKNYLDGKFENVIFVENKLNNGTVKNAISAIEKANSKYVKYISPGDYFVKDDILYRWVSFMNKTEAKWSFSDAVYYSECAIKKKINAHPIDIRPYKYNNLSKCRWNYLALGDLALGTVIIGETYVIDKYLRMIENSVIYADDNIYRLMMFDNIVGAYYEEKTIYYEYGTGISTSSNKAWGKKISDDFIATNNIMYKKLDDDFDYKKYQILKAIQLRGKIKKIFLIKGWVSFKLKELFFGRKVEIKHIKNKEVI